MDNNVLNNIESELLTAKSTEELENIRLKYLGRNGLINKELKKIKDMVPEKRKKFGAKLNEIKNLIIQIIEIRKSRLIKTETSQKHIDETLPGKQYPKGSLHVVTYAIDEISRIFEKLGFIRMSYPEVEWEYFSFEALNMPARHPARDDVEASFIEHKPDKKYGRMVLSPHTSSGQIREMLRVGKPPIRMINISKCYRPNWDATHTPMFFQFEGLCIDYNINITHLKGALDFFAKHYFGKDRETRLRPHHFQFTEPSFEVDITCDVCNGCGEDNNKKCKICKSGWLELGGTGMVHPSVLKAGGIDPEVYSGWAFGFGIERVIMMKYGIDDIRYYYNGDIRFLEQF